MENVNTTSLSASDKDSKTITVHPVEDANRQTNKAMHNAENAKKSHNTLEEALLCLDDLCDGARESDGHGFNKDDSKILRQRAEKLRETGILENRKDTLKRLKKYKNTQLAPAGFDYDAIVEQEIGELKSKAAEKSDVEIKVDPVIRNKAFDLLISNDLVKARREYIAKTVYGSEHAINGLTYICISTYLGKKYVIHADVVGDSQAGKSTATVKSLEIMPPEDIIPFSEMSQKYIYYKSRDTDFINKIIYIDDARNEHIPILKTLRNDSEGSPSHGTVINGESVDMVITGRPAVIASSVKPLRDLEGQATNRGFLITIEKPSKDTKEKVHAKIRQNIGKGALRTPSGQDEEKLILQEASRILRDEGIKDILIPFDAEEPEGSENRATAQFSRLIVISAFIHQYRRPILHIGDRKFVLATYADLENALDIWFGLGVAHRLKISPSGIMLLKELPIVAPNPGDGSSSKNVMTSQRLHTLTGMAERTVTAHLEDLYEAGLVNRCRIKAQGSPFAYWTDPELSKIVNAEKSTSKGIEDHLSNIQQKAGLPKYEAKYKPDCLKTSISSFFKELSKEKEKVSIEIVDILTNEEAKISVEEFYSWFWIAEKENEALHSEVSSKEVLPDTDKEVKDSDYPAMGQECCEEEYYEEEQNGPRVRQGRSLAKEIMRFEDDLKVAN